MPTYAAENVERHERWLSQHEERIKSLELSRAKLLGMVLAVNIMGSVIGSLIVLTVTHFWK